MSNHCIIVAEDDIEFRRVLECYLQDSPSEIITCSDGREVLAYLDGYRRKEMTILLDMIMKPVDGMTVLKYLAKNRFAVNVVVLTGDDITPETLMNEVGEDFILQHVIILKKPVALQKINRTINALERKYNMG